jgi:glycosyltransferase involved in cell wall biosynthesis
MNESPFPLTPEKTMKITAIICFRNEEIYLDVTLAHLTSCGIHLALIDNDSTDRSLQICEKYRPWIVYQSRLPYCGFFDMLKVLEFKAEAIRRIESDWFIHQDADEILESPIHDESLRDGIEHVARDGWTVINFDEFVFVPSGADENFEYLDFYQGMLSYYFFEPYPQRLMRVWKNSPDVAQVGGGHKLEGPGIRIYPENFILRHYPNLSLAHAQRKYPLRKFSPEALAKGWHFNRLNVQAHAIAFPAPDHLKRLQCGDDKNIDRREPWKKHFWESLSCEAGKPREKSDKT